MIFRPAVLTLIFFVYLAVYALWAPDNLTELQWSSLDKFHDLIAITAGFSFAFSNKPIDKGAISLLWAYVALLFCFDWLVPPGHIEAFAIVAAGFIGWIVYRRGTDNLVFGGERTRRSKDDPGL